MLGASGHIAGVITPPAKNKRIYWINDRTNDKTNDKLPAKAADWMAQATEKPGSWWTEWTAFLKPLGGKQVASVKSYGNRQFKAIEPAPGRYVKQKA